MFIVSFWDTISIMKNTNTYKKELEAEKARLQEEITDANTDDLDPDLADESELADDIEERESNAGVAEKLKAELRNVERALDKITDGTYGSCDVCQAEIPEARLKANPASTTCLAHSK